MACDPQMKGLRIGNADRNIPQHAIRGNANDWQGKVEN